jgi:outer membrane murein-binding lipoprotein Lpp
MEIQMKNIILFLLSAIITGLLIAGCESENSLDNPISTQSQIDKSINQNDVETLGKFSNELLQELSIARSSTTRYHRIEKAIEDGYADINVIVQGMGYHYMKAENVDGTFDPAKPELLVYTKNLTSGKMRLVAVEYAVPNTEPLPEGFTGNEDVWINNADFGLWLLHAWVWYHNPDGIFNSTNPRVHVEEDEITYP